MAPVAIATITMTATTAKCEERPDQTAFLPKRDKHDNNDNNNNNNNNNNNKFQ
jgi:hypothetical protein